MLQTLHTIQPVEVMCVPAMADVKYGVNVEPNPEFFGTRVGCHVSAVEWV